MNLMCILHAGVLVYSCVLLWLEDLAWPGYGAKTGADVQQGHSKNQDKEETGHSGGHRQHADASDASATRFWHRFKIALPAANMVISHHLPVSALTIRDLHLTRKIWKIYRSQSCTSVHIRVNSATHVTTIHTAKSPTVGSQVLQFSGLCQLLFIVHFLEESIETPGTAQWHFRLPHHGFGPEPFFGLRETSLSA